MATQTFASRAFGVIFLLNVSWLAAQESDQLTDDEPRLESLHGTMITSMSDDWPPEFGELGEAHEIWAKGDYVRIEQFFGDLKVIEIQRGNLMYIYAEGDTSGMKAKIRGGLGALGVIRQIEEVKAHGSMEESDVAQEDVYLYDVNAAAEVAVVYLSRETSLPRLWISTLRTEANSPRSRRTIFRDMEANVEIADEMFQVPADVEFSSGPPFSGDRQGDQPIVAESRENESQRDVEGLGGGIAGTFPRVEDLDEDELLAGLPHNLSQAYLRLFHDAVLYAFVNGLQWADNLQVAALWRAGLAEFTSECFFGEQAQCMLQPKTDRQHLVDIFGQAFPTDAPGWDPGERIDRETVVRGLVDLMALLLAGPIDQLYERIEENENSDERQAPPELVYTLIGSVGRYMREEELKMTPLGSAAENTGFSVMMTQSAGDLSSGMLLADRPIEHRASQTVPNSLVPLTMAEVSEHMAGPENQARLRALLVPEGRTGGASLFLQEEAERARQLANEGELAEAMLILTAVRNESDHPEFNNYLDDFLATTATTALETLFMAAEQGNVAAQFTLGMMYHTGDGVPQDFEQAAEWFREAANQGDAVAQHNLGVMYRDGQGVMQDNEAAISWFRTAAEQGYPPAQHNLGVAYSTGTGVEPDNVVGLSWIRLAAEQGFPTAQRDLGMSYVHGIGVEQDYVEAYAWLTSAEAQQPGLGEEERNAIVSEMTERQMQRAEELARDYQDRYIVD